MDSSFIDRIVALAKPEVVEIDGRKYSDRSLYQVRRSAVQNVLEVSTLSAIVDFFNTGEVKPEDCIIHIESPTKVSVWSKLDDGVRDLFLIAQADVPRLGIYSWGNYGYMETQVFIVALHTDFVQSETRDSILRLVSNVMAEEKLIQNDDGITQVVTMRKGVTFIGKEPLPNPVKLAKWRTFQEIEQPESDFLFRAKEGPKWALVEADGGKWRLKAMASIDSYLRSALEGKVITIF